MDTFDKDRTKHENKKPDKLSMNSIRFREKISERIKSLVDEFITAQRRKHTFEEPLIHFEMKKTNSTAYTWFYDHRVASVTFSPKRSFDLAIKRKNGSIHECDFLCATYGTPVQIHYSGKRAERYIIFEVYYKTHTATCIMPLQLFKARNTFSELGMDKSDWTNAKLQMELWADQVSSLNLEIKLPEEEYPLPPAISQRFDDAITNPNQKLEYFYPYQDKIIWPVISYILSIQLLPFLPPQYHPNYTICYVCQEKDIPFFQTKLKNYLSGIFSGDAVINGAIKHLTKYIKDDGSNAYYGWPYLLPVGKGSSPAANSVLAAVTQYALTPYKDKPRHPFRNHIPILLSTQAIPSSIVLNIPVSKGDLDSEWPSIENIKNNIHLSIFNLSSKYFSHDSTTAFKSVHATLPKLYNQAEMLSAVYDDLAYLAAFFSWLYYGPNTSPGRNWLRIQSKNWTTQPVTTEESLAAVLKYLRENIPDPDFLPSSLDDFKGEHPIFTKGHVDKDSGTTETLIYWNKRNFENTVSFLCPHFTAQDLLPLLLEDGYLLVGKDASHKNQKAVNIHGKAIWGYCFYKSKVDGTTEGSS